MLARLKRSLFGETVEKRHMRLIKEAGMQPMVAQDLTTGSTRLLPLLEDSSKDGENLSIREVQCIEQNECPDCGGVIRWGPCGGMSQNVKCFPKEESGESCGVKFNYTGAMSQRLEDRKAA